MSGYLSIQKQEREGIKMNIGIDLDHTITDAPWLFRILAKGLLAEGHLVYIITYRENREDTIKDLHDLDIPYTELITPLGDTLPPGPWKAKIAEKINLDIMIDDAPEVIRDMPKKVKTLWMFDKSVFDINTCILGIKASPNIQII